MISIYGIANCDKCRAAREWFKARGQDIRFHDLRADGLDAATVKRWQTLLGDAALINRRSQTWRKIPAQERENLDTEGNCALMLRHPTLIKRPIVDNGTSLLLGYDEPSWKALLPAGKNT